MSSLTTQLACKLAVKYPSLGDCDPLPFLKRACKQGFKFRSVLDESHDVSLS